MKKPLLIILSLLLIVGAGLALWRFVLNTNDLVVDNVSTELQDTPANSTNTSLDSAMPAPTNDGTSPVSSAPEMTVQLDRYVTLSEFNENKSIYDSVKKVYFFHAPWCPICKAIDEDITSNENQIPESTVFIKTDFDNNTSLRQKYGVTYQYTFVQVNNSGDEQKQWSATTLDKAIAGIQ